MAIQWSLMKMLKIECVARMGKALEENMSVGEVALQDLLLYLSIYAIP